jgi:Carbohydrate esterase, sialic acid-specific acetylesterase
MIAAILTVTLWLSAQYDSFGRLIARPQKQEASCFAQDRATGVLLVAGQSNAANRAERPFATRFPGRVLNFFQGRCYVASSPLLGASGSGGEFVTPLADALIEQRIFQRVVITSTAVTSTSISQWASGGDLNAVLLDAATQLSQHGYRVTAFIWHQGETDFGMGTPSNAYEANFRSMLHSLKEVGMTAPAFIAVASKCGLHQDWWTPDNKTSTAQRNLIDGTSILLGADTDAILDEKDRIDGCHFSETGQIKTAAAYAEAISAFFLHGRGGEDR